MANNRTMQGKGADKFKDPVSVDCLVGDDADAQSLCPSCGLAVSTNALVCPNDGVRLSPIVGDTKLSDKYEFLGKLAEGGMGAVYKVRHKLLDKNFAIKILHANMSSQSGVKRFKREAQTTMELRHPGIVGVHDLGVSDQGQPFIVMELVSGRTLAQLIETRSTPALPEVLKMFRQIAEAVAYAHGKGVIHRDIKPSNIIIEESKDGTLQARLLDFGIAHITENDGNTITSTGEVFGSPGYMSPEQCAGQPADERSDVYSLACTLYEALTGRTPFTGANPMELVFKHHNEKPLSMTDACGGQVKFSQALERVMEIALAKNREERFATMTEFADALDKAAKDVTPARSRSTSGPRRPSAKFAFALASTAMLFGALFIAVVPHHAAPTYKVGQPLEVKWENAWYGAQVLEVNGSRVRVHYLNYDNTYDEWVTPDRLHTFGNPDGGGRKLLAKDIKRGDDLEVDYQGHWYHCDVLGLNAATDQVFIHYAGYEDKDNVWVSTGKLRTPVKADDPNFSK